MNQIRKTRSVKYNFKKMKENVFTTYKVINNIIYMAMIYKFIRTNTS